MSTSGYTRLRQHSTDSTNAVTEHGHERTSSALTAAITDAPIIELRLDTRTAQAIEEESDAHLGVKKVEAAEKVYGRYSRWILFTSLGLASYIYSLDASTTSAYLAFATSTFEEHSLLSSITVAHSIIVAVGKPVITKVADVTSRATAYLVVLIFYVAGYIVIASAQNVGMLAGGIVLYAVGYTGLQLLTQIVIADLTTLQWRGLVSALVSLPFLVNGFIGPNISTKVLETIGWRWGYGMFAILVPLTLFPLISILFWAEAKAKKLGIVDQVIEHSRSPTAHRRSQSLTAEPANLKAPAWRTKVQQTVEQLDLLGLVLLGSGVSLILLPLTLSQSVGKGWASASIISMLILGLVLLAVFVLWDLRYASRPVIAPRFVRNRSLLFASCVGFFDFMSFWLTATYLYTFVLVVKPWTLLQSTYFMQILTIALTVFGFVGGLSMYYFRRYKWVLIAGLIIRLIGVALMIHSRGARASTAELIWTQILQGMGGGFAAAASQVGAQASVPHVDVAMVTALVLLVTEIGGAIGGATAGAIWTSTMPAQLAKHLPFLSEEERKKLFGDLESVIQIPRGDPVREGVISAYDETMKIMVIVATVLSVIPILTSLWMPNWYLGDKQNAVVVDTSSYETIPEDEDERYRDSEEVARDRGLDDDIDALAERVGVGSSAREEDGQPDVQSRRD